MNTVFAFERIKNVVLGLAFALAAFSARTIAGCFRGIAVSGTSSRRMIMRCESWLEIESSSPVEVPVTAAPLTLVREGTREMCASWFVRSGRNEAAAAE